MKRVIMLVLALACLIFPAYAEDVQTVDATAVASVSMDESYLRLTCPIEGEQQVTVMVTDARGGLQYQRDYGLCSGMFRSEDIYLRLDGGETVYQVTVQVDGVPYFLTVTRVMPRLTDNLACSAGYPLAMLSGSGAWQSATILDVAALEGSSTDVPLIASGAYTLGTVTFTVSGGQLTASAELFGGVDGSIDRATVYVATNALQAQGLGGRRFMGATGRLDERMDLEGTPYAAVYVELRVSFDPSGVPGMGDAVQDGQDMLWMLMQDSTANEAVG